MGRKLKWKIVVTCIIACFWAVPELHAIVDLGEQPLPSPPKSTPELDITQDKNGAIVIVQPTEKEEKSSKKNTQEEEILY